MHLNTLKPAVGSKMKRVRTGRGTGCGLGKTCGRGHKGAKARSGYSSKNGFEGCQLPLQRRLPKFGFTSRTSKDNAEVQLHVLNKIDGNEVSLLTLKKANLIGRNVKFAKVILSGKLEKTVVLSGVAATAGARKVIEALGGKIE